ncbi:hypothetical protein Desdi_0870 [Desulfitobacterium dichloroeliminans LMG P-21439]|uniref:Uncharacterized protein n=1 Tax=Desulfitobacterium dichloroeliminans (strain LMG P-21439 / DCA1) TaxID=871963 RepID=L0F606_DESDL|nr:hypothetical protein [Desulfitobacterium dichloroeliminans]AGA68393.1 hypothetical protein Desdi_0870 [Desulfitobacterium dichloroeliminans LMG P-21439]
MKKFTKKACALALAAVFALSSSVVPVLAADNALMKAPAKDAAFVAGLEGFKNVTGKNLLDQDVGMQEGLIIRQSRVENGKIIIPKSGLYYTTRTGTADMLTGHKVTILGKEYTIVDTATRLDVITNADVKKGGSVPLGDGSKHLELSSIGIDGNGFQAPEATFQILKPSGNYYGSAFEVSPNAKLRNIAEGVLNDGTGRKTGTYYPGKDGQNFHVEYYGSPVAISGQSYLVAGEVTAEVAHVKEFATGAIVYSLLSDKPAVEMKLGKGEKATLGDYTVTVTDITKDSVSVELTSKDGKVTQKTLGPLTEDTMKYLPADEVTRNSLVVRPENDTVQVQLDAFREPFKDGKVALVGYTDLVKFENPGTWASDPRFISRPDT